MVLGLLILLSFNNKVKAQTFRVEKADCNMNHVSIDNGIKLRKWQWRLVGTIRGEVIFLGMRKILGLRSKPAKISSTMLQFVPHLIGGFITKSYPIDLMDWLHDSWNTSPYLFNPLTYTLGSVALMCFGHP